MWLWISIIYTDGKTELVRAKAPGMGGNSDSDSDSDLPAPGDARG